MDLGPVTGLRGEAAIGAGDDVFSSDDLGIANKSLGNEFRVLDDVAGVRDDARDQTLAGRQPNRLPYMVLVFVSRVRTFEGVESSLDLQHVANDVLQFGVEDPRTLVYSVAGVKAHHLVGDAIERVIEGVHEEASFALLLCIVISQVRIHVGQEGIVNLKIKSCVYDRLVFLAQGAANGVVVLLVGSIVLVQAGTAWRDRR